MASSLPTLQTIQQPQFCPRLKLLFFSLFWTQKPFWNRGFTRVVLLIAISFFFAMAFGMTLKFLAIIFSSSSIFHAFCRVQWWPLWFNRSQLSDQGPYKVLKKSSKRGCKVNWHGIVSTLIFFYGMLSVLKKKEIEFGWKLWYLMKVQVSFWGDLFYFNM